MKILRFSFFVGLCSYGLNSMATEFQCFPYRRTPFDNGNGGYNYLRGVLVKVIERENHERIEVLANIIAVNEKVDDLLSTLSGGENLCIKGDINLASGRQIYVYDAKLSLR
jgi:hypothetical protein